jgi:2-polyprenyl-3-methyl-5-hydroxy-6-metoxy-1,4-benzoquinol methylase
MTNQSFEQYDAHYRRANAFRDSKILDPRELQRDRAPTWLHRLSKDAHILDYGCADGYMLSVLNTLGYQNLLGADISESMLQHARTRLEGTAVQLRHLDSYPLHNHSGSFDAIIMNQVLEHIPREDVIPTLNFLHNLLKPGGFISVGVPNAARLLGGFAHASDFTHLTPFTEHSLRQVLEMAGLVQMELVTHPPRLFFP